MKKFSLTLFITGLVFIAFTAFGEIHNSKTNNQSSKVKGESSIPGYARGKQIYNSKCISCHQATGMGIPGVFPPLKGSDFLQKATKRKLLEQVIKGSNETYDVNGTTYSSAMPPQVDNINDAVAVVNYVLNSWGNKYGTATAADGKGLIPSSK